jgi:hypothetical protein
MDNRLNVYVPAPGSDLGIVPGSGIVGTRQPALPGVRAIEEDGLVLVDYEGNLYGASNVRTLEDRLHHAAGRHIMRYPTVARRLARVSELVFVGDYFYDEKRLLVTRPNLLEEWRARYEGASHA